MPARTMEGEPHVPTGQGSKPPPAARRVARGTQEPSCPWSEDTKVPVSEVKGDILTDNDGCRPPVSADEIGMSVDLHAVSRNCLFVFQRGVL